MALSIRSQIYAVCLGMLVALAMVMARVSATTAQEQRRYVQEEAARYGRLLADQATPATGQREWATLLRAAGTVLPPGSVVWVAVGDDPALAGTRPDALDAFLLATAPTLTPPLLVHVAVPRAVAVDRTWRIYRRNFITTLSATLVAILIAFVLTHRWRRGLRVLEQHARRVGTGDRTPHPPARMPSSELAAVQRALLDMEQNLVFLERQVVRQERLAAIGVLASGLAHELNNPLQAIAGRAQLVLHDGAVQGASRADLELIRKESERASVIIRNLSRFSRQEPIAPAAVKLTEVITAVVELRQRRLQELGIHLQVDDLATGSCLAVVAELQQVMLNFVVNAEQAMATMKRGQKLLTIRTRDLPGRVYCEVEDTGPGVSTDDQAKLFQPFFTTKSVGEGTGLGLSVSYGIIESSGGRIGHRSAETGGAIFWFELPQSS